MHHAAPLPTPPRASSLFRSLARGLLADPAIEGDPLKWLAICDAYWSALRSQPPKRGPAVVRERASKKLGAPPSYDVVVAGGTLGLLVAAALQARGLATAVLERRAVAGRDQEWNTTRDELKASGKRVGSGGGWEWLAWEEVAWECVASARPSPATRCNPPFCPSPSPNCLSFSRYWWIWGL